MVAAAMVALAPAAANSGEAVVTGATIEPDQRGGYTINATVRHDDRGWDHYANRWVVLGEDGSQIGERILLHPHEDEQPFTRSLNGIQVPEGVAAFYVQAFDSVHGAGPRFGPVAVPGR